MLHRKDTHVSHVPTLWDRMVAIATAIGVLGTFATIAVTVHLANEQLTEQRDEVKIQHLVDESARFDQEPLLSERKALAAQRIDHNHATLVPMDYDNSPPELWDVLNACDHIGLLTRRGYLDVTDVWNEFGYEFFNVYADAHSVIEDDRKNDPASMENCIWLIDEMTPIEIKKSGGSELHPSEADLYGFYNGEFDAKPGKLPARNPRK